MKRTVLKPRSTSCTVNFDAPGKQNGFVYVPTAQPSSALGAVQIPLTIIANGTGPTVVLLAGADAKNFNGTLGVQQLARLIEIDQVNGRIILIPDRHSASVQRQTEEQFNAFLIENVISIADAVIELKSGDATTNYAASAAVYQNPGNKTLQETAEQCMIAFGAPNSVRLLPCEPGSMASKIQNANVPLVTTMLGGGASASSTLLNLCLIGCKNALLHLGVLNTELELCSTRMLEVNEESCFLLAPNAGLLQPCKEVGEEVFRGSPVAFLVDPTKSGASLQTISANRNGVLLARHHDGLVRAGDCVALLADEVQR